MKLSSKTKKILLAIVLIGLVVGAWTVWYVFFKPHRNVATEKAAYTLTTQGLTDAFKTDTAATAKYIDKAILIEGPVSAVEGTHLSFGNITCNMDSAQLDNVKKLAVGQSVKVQGRLTTYNALMEEILLDQCVLK